jgi:hypothetical protein
MKAALSLAALLCLASGLHAGDWKPLFNGKDLEGWHQVNGTAPFAVKDGAIVGTTVEKSPNSFLATKDLFGDFILEFEVRMEPGRTFNSGVQFRSLSLPDYQNGRVHGYQVEIDPSERGYSGGIYDEARRGWLYPVNLNPPALRLFRVGEWNHYRIEAIGNSLRTWVNGKPVAHVEDATTPRGFIAVQVHSIAKAEEAGRTVAWRNLRIQTDNLQPSAPTPDVPVKSFLTHTP